MEEIYLDKNGQYFYEFTPEESELAKTSGTQRWTDREADGSKTTRGQIRSIATMKSEVCGTLGEIAMARWLGHSLEQFKGHISQRGTGVAVDVPPCWEVRATRSLTPGLRAHAGDFTRGKKYFQRMCLISITENDTLATFHGWLYGVETYNIKLPLEEQKYFRTHYPSGRRMERGGAPAPGIFIPVTELHPMDYHNDDHSLCTVWHAPNGCRCELCLNKQF